MFFTPETKRGVLFLLSPGAVSCSMGSGREVEVPALAREPLLDSFLAACSASREALAARSTCGLPVGGALAPDPLAGLFLSTSRSLISIWM